MKTVLITGASSGFGYLTTLLLARKKYHVFAGVRDIEKHETKELKKIAETENLSIEIVKLDVTKQSDIEALKTIAESIDVLINNAGIGFIGPAEEFSMEEIKEQFDINFFGTVQIIKTIVPYMQEKKSGKILVTSSIAGLLSFPLYGLYSASKYALEAYCEALRFELHPFNIDVALIEPGSFLTNFTKNKHVPVAQKNDHSSYKRLTDRFFNKYKKFDDIKNNNFLASLFNPDRVAQKMVQIVESKHSKLHNVVGYDAQLFLALNAIIPNWLKNYLLGKVYKWR